MAKRAEGKNTKAGGPKEGDWSKSDCAFAVLAALLVIFSAMVDPRFSVGMAAGMLVVFALYKYQVSRGMRTCGK